MGPDVLVGIFLERSIEMMVALLATMKAGGAYVPLDPGYPEDRLNFILQDAKAHVLLTQKSLADKLSWQGAHKILLDADWDAISRHDTNDLAASSGPADLAYVLYTSGSTGRPKGVQIEHRNLTNFLSSMSNQPGLSADDSLLAVTTLSFDIAGLELYLPLISGAKIIMASREDVADGRRLLKLLNASGATVMQATPATWRMLIDVGWTGKAGLKALCGGEALPAGLAEQLVPLCSELWNMYGPTETTIWSTLYKVEANFGGTVPIGRPIANTLTYILDKFLKPVPIGVTGELYIGGDGLARGYLHRPELTAEKFVSSPFPGESAGKLYRTGDLARYLPDGNIQYSGRADFQVKVRGFRIELGEIETVLAANPAIQECAVIAREDAAGSKVLTGYIVAKPGHEPATSELRAHLKLQLPEYMVPSVFVKLAALPLTPNGKLDRKSLPAPENSFQKNAAVVMPRDEVERTLVKIWKRVLGRKSIGIMDDFFEMGGHSLLAVRLMTEINKTFGKEIPLAALFQGATVEYLARIVRGTEFVHQQLLVEIQGGGSKPPFFVAVLPGVNSLGYLPLSKHLGTDQPFYKLQLPERRFRNRPYTASEFEMLAADYVDAMRALQPEGPYYLGGMCDGARIAFDMARLLKSQGETVGLLAVFDTWVIENSQRRLFWTIYYYSQRLRKFGKLSLGQKAKMAWGTIRNKANRLSRSAKNSHINEGSEWRAAYWPDKGFVAPKHDGRITVFKTQKQPYYYINDPLMGWGGRTTAGVDIHVINVRHLLMLREPHVIDLARELSKCLTSAHCPQPEHTDAVQLENAREPQPEMVGEGR